MSLPSVMRPPGMAVGKAPARPPDSLRSLAASRVWLRSKLDSMSAWHASSPFLVTSCCAPSSLFRLSKNSVGRSFAAAPHLHCSAYRSWRLLYRTRSEAQLAPCRGQSAVGCPFRCALLGQRWPRTQRPRLRLTACATLAPHDTAGAPSA